MPTAPTLGPDQMKAAGASMPQVNPVNFLLAAAEAHSQGQFQSAPVPAGVDLQSGKVNRRKQLKVVK